MVYKEMGRKEAMPGHDEFGHKRNKADSTHLLPDQMR